MDGSTWVLIAAIALLLIGFVLTIIFGEKALNKAFSPGSDHGLFWAGIVSLAGGFGFLIIYIFMKISRINTLTKENYGLYSKINSLQEQLGQCKGGPVGPGSSGPGFFSRMGSKIGGFFSRNTSVPAAGNPGEVNPFKNQ
jgi:hypothetical protein